MLTIISTFDAFYSTAISIARTIEPFEENQFKLALSRELSVTQIEVELTVFMLRYKDEQNNLCLMDWNKFISINKDSILDINGDNIHPQTKLHNIPKGFESTLKSLLHAYRLVGKNKKAFLKYIGLSYYRPNEYKFLGLSLNELLEKLKFLAGSDEESLAARFGLAYLQAINPTSLEMINGLMAANAPRNPEPLLEAGGFYSQENANVESPRQNLNFPDVTHTNINEAKVEHEQLTIENNYLKRKKQEVIEQFLRVESVMFTQNSLIDTYRNKIMRLTYEIRSSSYRSAVPTAQAPDFSSSNQSNYVNLNLFQPPNPNLDTIDNAYHNEVRNNDFS